jgi:hypothetical protein
MESIDVLAGDGISRFFDHVIGNGLHCIEHVDAPRIQR